MSLGTPCHRDKQASPIRAHFVHLYLQTNIISIKRVVKASRARILASGDATKKKKGWILEEQLVLAIERQENKDSQTDGRFQNKSLLSSWVNRQTRDWNGLVPGGWSGWPWHRLKPTRLYTCYLLPYLSYYYHIQPNRTLPCTFIS